MTRSIGHLLLILVLLACPVQCVVGGDSCCGIQSDDRPTESSVPASRTCSAGESCCHHQTEQPGEPLTADGDQQQPVPHSDTGCSCDCLCKGAISSSVQLAEELDTPILSSVITSSTVGADMTGGGLISRPAEPPDVLSGRKIRTLRMSFQV